VLRRFLGARGDSYEATERGGLGARSDGGGVAIFWVHATIATQQRHATGFLGARGDSYEVMARNGFFGCTRRQRRSDGTRRVGCSQGWRNAVVLDSRGDSYEATERGGLLSIADKL